MKLATLKDGTRDGKLVVVSSDLTRCTDASFLAPTMQAALDDWQRISPHLAVLAESLEGNAVPSDRFHEHQAHSPLPRAYQRSGGGTTFSDPREPVAVDSAAAGLTVSADLAAIVTDLPAGASAQAARDAVALVMLSANVMLAEDGSGMTSAFSPVAVTPDELDEAWDGAAAARLHLLVNGKPVGGQEASAGSIDLGSLVAGAAARRRLSAGAIIDAAAPNGSTSPGLRAGDTFRVEMMDRPGHSIFGAIEQAVQLRER